MTGIAVAYAALRVAINKLYQCNRLPGKTRLGIGNDLLCVERDAKPYSLTHSLVHSIPPTGKAVGTHTYTRND